MNSFFFSRADPWDLLELLEREQGSGATFQCMRRCVEVALDSGLFHGGKQFYCFHDFNSGIVEFGVHRWLHTYDPVTGEFPPDACFIEFVGCGDKSPPAEPFSPKPLLDGNCIDET